MRISDWSSDVCSSALTLDPLKRKLRDPEGVSIPISTAEFRLLCAFLDHPRAVLDRDRLLDMVQGRTAHMFDRAEIGRASCRERVLSVRVDLGDRSILTKKHTIKLSEKLKLQ